MATAETRTLLPLDRFAEIVSFSPILFNQVYVPDTADGDERQPLIACSDALMQYTWQARGGGLPSREEIALAIRQAEDRIEQCLKFSPLPKWYEDVVATPQRLAPGRLGTAYGSGGYPFMWHVAAPYELRLQVPSKYVIEGGQEAYSLIDDNAAITYTDGDGDGYAETATVTVNTTITDSDQIAVFYPGVNHNTAWEIRPISVSFAGGVATIEFKRHQCVLPALLERLNAQAANGLVDANFLTTVDVYRRYNDPSQMAVIEWQPPICDDDACTVSAQGGCLAPIDGKNGIVGVHAASWDADTDLWTHTHPTWWRQPTRVRLWYRAGWKEAGSYRHMRLQFEQAIAFLALTFMDREWTSCEPLHNLQARWRTDLAIRESGPAKSISYNISRGMLDNPLGTTRAADFAWQVIQQLAVGEAVTTS
jgi:hypothetical protein